MPEKFGDFSNKLVISAYGTQLSEKYENFSGSCFYLGASAFGRKP